MLDLPHPYVFHEVLILKAVKVVRFDTVLYVLILNDLEGAGDEEPYRLDGIDCS